MARKRPTVVKGPFDIAIVFCKPLKKHLDVDLVAVQIIKMHYIWLNLIKSSKKTFRSVFAMKTRPTIHASLKHVKFNLYIRSKLHFVRFFSLTPSTPEHIRIFTSREKFAVLLHHDATGRAVRHGINVGVDRH